MLTLGLDPGFARIGYGLIKKEKGRLSVIDCGCISTKVKQEFPDRLVQVGQDLEGLIKKHRPDQCAIEDLFFFKNAKTALAVAAARGVLIFVAKKNKLPVFEYTPLQVKQSVTGYGKAEKNQVLFMVEKILRIKDFVGLDDTSDALAIAICHANSIASFLKKKKETKTK